MNDAAKNLAMGLLGLAVGFLRSQGTPLTEIQDAVKQSFEAATPENAGKFNAAIENSGISRVS